MMGIDGQEGNCITFEFAAGIGIPCESLFVFGGPSLVPFGIFSRTLNND